MLIKNLISILVLALGSQYFFLGSASASEVKDSGYVIFRVSPTKGSKAYTQKLVSSGIDQGMLSSETRVLDQSYIIAPANKTAETLRGLNGMGFRISAHAAIPSDVINNSKTGLDIIAVGTGLLRDNRIRSLIKVLPNDVKLLGYGDGIAFIQPNANYNKKAFTQKINGIAVDMYGEINIPKSVTEKSYVLYKVSANRYSQEYSVTQKLVDIGILRGDLPEELRVISDSYLLVPKSKNQKVMGGLVGLGLNVKTSAEISADVIEDGGQLIVADVGLARNGRLNALENLLSSDIKVVGRGNNIAFLKIKQLGQTLPEKARLMKELDQQLDSIGIPRLSELYIYKPISGISCKRVLSI